MQSSMLRAVFRPDASKRMCKSCIRRQFSSSSTASVHRPQVPYDLPKPLVDPYGFPVRESLDSVDEHSEDDPVWRKRVADSEKDESIENELRKMAEPTRLGFYERYGSHDGYGLKNKDRWRVNEEGKLEKWEAAGADWKSRLGFRSHAFRPGARVEVIGFQHRKSPKLPVNYSYQPRLDTPWGKKMESVEAIHDPFLQLAEEYVAPPRMERAAPPHVRASPNAHETSDEELGGQEKQQWRRDGRENASDPLQRNRQGVEDIEGEGNVMQERNTLRTGRLGTRPAPPRITQAPSSHLPIRRLYSSQQQFSLSRRRANYGDKRAVAPNVVTPDDKRPWRPNKKLTYSAMAGVRALHESDPVKYDRQYLAKHFGISYEAVTRILKSRWRSKASLATPEPVPAGTNVIEEKSITGTKWDRRPETSPKYSAIHALRQL